jgi:peptidyl-prolyl cis-trans isomerase SurA
MKLIRLIYLSLIIFTPLGSVETHIVFKVNNQIITNMDLNNEYRYLMALNNELTNIDKNTLLKVAKDSIIREKIKENELLRYYNLGDSPEYLEPVIKNFYQKLEIKDLNGFKEYLLQYDLEIDTVRDKIEIEVLWNKLIANKYQNQLNIKKKVLKEKIEKNSSDKIIKEYELSEIIFQIKNINDLDNKVKLIQKNIKEQGFKNTANIFSISESSKFGGNIGWLDEKKLSKEINLAINELKISEISKPIRITNGFLILKINNIRQKEIKFDREKLLDEAIIFETNKQYNQFSIIYYNKIKINSVISEY